MADVNVKMGVSGIQQFKQGMTDAQASVKTFDAALKANEKQLKATGNAENFMQAQTTLLNGKLKEQEKIAKNAEQALKQMEANGVKPTSKSYQDMQRKLIEAQSAMLDTQMELDGLGTKAAEATGKTDKLGDSLGGLNKKISLDQVISVVDKLTTGMENAAKKAVKLGEDLWNSIMDSAKWADDTATMAQMYGIDLDTFQRMQKLVTNGLDTSVDAILNAQSKLNKGVGNQAKDTMETLEQLGLAISSGKDDAAHLITDDQTELFWKAGAALMDMTDAFDKEAAAQSLFGRSWKELVPLFKQFKSLDEYNDALEDVNVVSEDSVEDLAALNDKIGELKGNFETLKTEVLGTLAPALQGAADALNGLLTRVLEYLQTPEGKQALDDLGKAVEGLFSDLGSIDPEAVVQGFSEVFNKIVGGVQWVVDNKDGIIAALEAAFGIWTTLKVSDGVLTISKLISGITGLAGGGAASAGAAAGASWGAAFANAVAAAAPWLIGLYTLLKPAGTAGPNLDQMYANGQVTEAGWEHWRNNPEQWNARLGAVGDRFGDLGSLVNNQAALNIIGDLTLDDEAVIQKLQDELGLVPVDTEPVVPENAAESIAEQIGPVYVPVVGDPTGRIRTPKGWVYPEDGEHANGLFSVPFDGYAAILHKGERVVPAREVAASRNYNSNLYVESMYMNNGTDAAGLAAAMAAAQRRTMRGYGS